MNEKDKFRHELKYLCTDQQMEFIQSRLQTLMQYDSHTENGRYKIRSLYFDNYDNRCYYENEFGVDSREKFRIRIYNASDKRISLECKRKEHGKTFKTSCVITKEQYFDLLNGSVDSIDLSQAPPLLRKFIMLIRTEFYKPVVIVEYERTPYVYNLGNVRITLDRNISSSNRYEDFFNDIIPSRPILPQGQHLLEVKYDELLPDFIKNVLQLGDLQQTAFSKYYLCRKYSIGG